MHFTIIENWDGLYNLGKSGNPQIQQEFLTKLGAYSIETSTPLHYQRNSNLEFNQENQVDIVGVAPGPVTTNDSGIKIPDNIYTDEIFDNAAFMGVTSFGSIKLSSKIYVVTNDGRWALYLQPHNLLHPPSSFELGIWLQLDNIGIEDQGNTTGPRKLFFEVYNGTSWNIIEEYEQGVNMPANGTPFFIKGNKDAAGVSYKEHIKNNNNHISLRLRVENFRQYEYLNVGSFALDYECIPFTETPTATPTLTSTNTPSHTHTPTQTKSTTPSKTTTATNTPSYTTTPSVTMSPTESQWKTLTPTPSHTQTPSHTPSSPVTPSYTPTHTLTRTPSNTPEPTYTATPTNTPISGSCCIEFPQLEGYSAQKVRFNIQVSDDYQIDKDLRYSAYLDDGTIFRDQPLKWDSRQGYYIDLNHTYEVSGYYSCYLVVDNPDSMRMGNCAHLYANIVSPTQTPSATSTRTITATPTKTKTGTPSNTPTTTKTLSATPTSTTTLTATPSKTPSTTKTLTATPTPSTTKTLSATPTTTTTLTATPSKTPSTTKTLTATHTPAETLTPTETKTQTPTVTPSVSNTMTLTPTVTTTATETQTATPSATITQTNTPSATITHTQTPTQTLTQTPSVTNSQTVTPTLTTSPTVTPSPIWQDLHLRFQYYSTYVVEGETAYVNVYREKLCCDYDYTGAFGVEYTTVAHPRSAASGIDFVWETGILEFRANQNVNTISIDTLDDTISEHSEYFSILLSGVAPSGTPYIQPRYIRSKILYKNPYQVLIMDDDIDVVPITQTPTLTNTITPTTTPTVTQTQTQTVTPTFTVTPSTTALYISEYEKCPEPIIYWGSGTSTGLMYTGGAFTAGQTGLHNCYISQYEKCPEPAIYWGSGISTGLMYTGGPITYGHTGLEHCYNYISQYDLCQTGDLSGINNSAIGYQREQLIPDVKTWGAGYVSTGLMYLGGSLTMQNTGLSC